jgi:hypothetical protein
MLPETIARSWPKEAIEPGRQVQLTSDCSIDRGDEKGRDEGDW